MLTAHTVEVIRAAETRAAADVGWDALMQSAAAGLADAVAPLLPTGEATVVLVGPGNNGGDALFAAARLREAGHAINLCLLDETAVHAGGLAAATAAGATVVPDPVGHRSVLDALFGIGARPGLTGRAADWAAWQRDARPATIAVDVPSGIDVDGGTLPADHVRAGVTVTFGTHKVGLLAGPADAAAGRLHLVDIGLARHLGAPALEAIDASDGHRLAYALAGSADQHKYSRGVVGIAAGSPRYAGAAHLSVAGAQAGPAGMVRFVGDPGLSARVVDRAPEVVAGDGRVQAWVVGPGAGPDVADHLRHAIAADVPVVVDAGALVHLPDRIDAPVLLTPHAGELATMLGVGRDVVEAAPLRHAREAADRWGATVLLKGRRTLVVPPGGGTARVNRTGSPWLATAGSGDVLAGLAGSLLAAGLDPLDAGSFAAHLHGLAGESRGPLTASEVARRLPTVIGSFLTDATDEEDDL